VRSNCSENSEEAIARKIVDNQYEEKDEQERRLKERRSKQERRLAMQKENDAQGL
jgi:hypothetical protein